MIPSFQSSALSRRLAIIGAVFVLAASAHATQLLTNAGFESGAIAPWSTTGGSISSAQAHTGSFSFAAYGDDSVTQRFAPVATSSISEFSFWGLRNEGLLDMVVIFYDTGYETYTVNTLNQGNGWTFINLTSQLDAGKSLVGFQIYGTTSGSNPPAYLDDFKLEVNSTNPDLGAASAVPEIPSSLSLLGFGLVALAALRTRLKKA